MVFEAKFFEAKRQKTIDDKKQAPHNLASLLLTNTTLRSPGLQADAVRMTVL
nr:hypothetical protein [uncultured Noviherbaspirillum sp.]